MYDLFRVLLDQLNNDILLLIWKTGARFEQHCSANDEKVNVNKFSLHVDIIY